MKSNFVTFICLRLLSLYRLVLTDTQDTSKDLRVLRLRRAVPSTHAKLSLAFFDTHLSTAAYSFQCWPFERADIPVEVERARHISHFCACPLKTTK